MKYRPSSLPALSKCAQFISSPGDEGIRAAGKLRHEVLAYMLTHPDAPEEQQLERLPEEHRAGVKWALDYIRVHAPMHDHPLIVEQLREWVGYGFENRRGTLDAQCGPVFFDLKWNRYDYAPQMADYALSLLDDWSEVTCHVLFGESQKAEVLRFDRATAEAIVAPVLLRAGIAPPTVCTYCGWCARQATCSAHLDTVNRIVEGRPDWQLSTFHSSDITDPQEMGTALTIARQVADWAEAVEFQAKEMAVKLGAIPKGFTLQTRQGNRFISSVSEAFPVAGLPQAEFLEACEVKLSSLSEAFAKFHGLKKAQAERDVQSRLGEIVQRKPSTVSLVKDKNASI